MFQCNDACGYAAAMGGAFCYGTYGVPIKATSSIDAHPIVLQSYKTSVVFLASMLIVFFAEEQPRWTSYGLLSGFLWVSGGTLGILAIRNTGVATAIGIWSSIMVIINFVWGILIFHEPVYSLTTTCLAFVFLVIGLMGMARFSSPGRNDDPKTEDTLLDETDYENLVVEKENDDLGLTSRLKRADTNDSIDIEDNDEYFGGKDATRKRSIAKRIFGRSLTPWETGIIYAVSNGVLSGSSMVPVHYAKLEGISNFSFYFSTTSGALIANITFWVALFLSNFASAHEDMSIGETFELMPKLHFKQLWWKLGAAGLLSNGGMFGGIMATASLGQAIGNSLMQLKILVSGLWGICYFKETKDRQSTVRWFISASICVASILALSNERRRVANDLGEENTLE